MIFAELARDMNLIIRPTTSTLSTCSGQRMTVEGCTWLTATANNVAIRARFLVAKGITEQVLLSCDDLINLLIVHKEFPNRTVTCKTYTNTCRRTKNDLREFPETLSDKLNEEPIRSGELMHIHLEDGA